MASASSGTCSASDLIGPVRSAPSGIARVRSRRPRSSESFRDGPLTPDADVDESARQEVIVGWPVDQCPRLCQAQGPGLRLRKGESGLAERVELGKISAGLDDVDLRVGTDVCEAELVNMTQQRPALAHGHAREGDVSRLWGGGPDRVGVADPHAEVWFLEHQPPTGGQPADYPS